MQSSFNLTDIVSVIINKWKTILVIVFLALIVSAITLFITPKTYQAEVTAVIQNPLLADKAKVFNSNIQGLYSITGDNDDLDAVYSLSKLNIIFLNY